MRIELNEDQKMIREAVTSIAQKELAPKAAQRDREGIFPKKGLQKLAEAGFLSMAVPKPMGGYGSDTLSFVWPQKPLPGNARPLLWSS